MNDFAFAFLILLSSWSYTEPYFSLATITTAHCTINMKPKNQKKKKKTQKKLENTKLVKQFCFYTVK